MGKIKFKIIDIMPEKGNLETANFNNTIEDLNAAQILPNKGDYITSNECGVYVVNARQFHDIKNGVFKITLWHK